MPGDDEAVEFPPASEEVAFLEAACVPPHAHGSGTLHDAEAIRGRYPQVTASNIYTAATTGDEFAVRAFLAPDPASATAKGGPRGWDALTHLCFSRYLRLDPTRSDAFLRTAVALLNAGASANTGWLEANGPPGAEPVIESAIYGAAALARHGELTRLLLDRGADPNDAETAYHVAETRDNGILNILLESGKLNPASLQTLLLRKCDWHDGEGLRLVLEHGADPNRIGGWGNAALHQAVRRDNALQTIAMLLDYGADPALPNRERRTAIQMAARRGRGDVLDLFGRRGIPVNLTGVDLLIAACARDHRESIRSLTGAEPRLQSDLIAQGGTLLAEFAGVGNLPGVRNLLDLGVSAAGLYLEGDEYFDIARNSTALHVAAWRGAHEVVRELIGRGTPVDATDARNRTALRLAIRACVDSHWTETRSPDSIRILLAAGASPAGIELPTGYDEADDLIRKHLPQRGPV